MRPGLTKGLGRRGGTLGAMAADFMRIGDAERDEAVGMLREHHATGRLSSEEFDERMSRALGARTHTEVMDLFHDLPAPRPGAPFAGPSAPTTPYGSSTPASYQTPTPAYGYDNSPDPYAYGNVPAPQPPHHSNELANGADVPWYAQWWMILVAVGVTIAIDDLWFIIPAMAIWLWVIYPSLSSNKRAVRPPAAPPRPLTYMEREYVMDEVRAGRKINAIKRYRELTGADLVAAKNTVESWSRQIGR